MSDIYGILVSQLGIDATTAADQDLILSSAFPMLKIAFSVKVTLTMAATTVDNTLFAHNLGYCPFFLVYDNNTDGLLYTYRAGDPTCTKTLIRISNFDSVPVTKDYTVIVCRNPLEKIITTPVFSTKSIEASKLDRDYGLIVSKNGKSADSTDYRDFTFHSNTRNLLIHKVDYRPITTSITWTNDLPYRPIFFGFASLDNGVSYQAMYGGGQSPPTIDQDGSGNVTINVGFAARGSIWILKDPFAITNNTTVTI